ncbi:universal stress protein [Pseudonocardia eucalypti]|uniref:Universal stress protein n=1 Tax=Pseudonocardia eucalypti TaxID=648755 RepID=A0ABP9RA04_9PSEU|nr:nucleotide-binding universal stress UspA family protein [Pseudonocardia eucalypti]
MGSYAKVLVGSDGSATSLLAVDRAGALAGDANAELIIVCAYEPASKTEVQAAAEVLKDEAYQVVGSAPAESVLRDAADRARSAGASKVETLAIQGPPVDVLDQAVADTGANLLVVGNVGLNTLTGRILGSVPQSVARRSGVDVLIVHTS